MENNVKRNQICGLSCQDSGRINVSELISGPWSRELEFEKSAFPVHPDSPWLLVRELPGKIQGPV
jgi:hypothetical protein